jgi:membrane fusion protein (multidrug efflux system)
MALKSKRHLWVAVVGIAALGAAAWWYQQRPAKPAVPTDAAAGSAAAPRAASGPAGGGGPAAVEVARAQTMRIEEDAQAVGTLRAAQTVMMRPEVSGRVVQIGFRDGATVRRGQLLVQLDDQLQRAQLQQAQAQAGIASSNLKRSRELQGEGFVSQSAVDQNLAALEVAQAQVALAQAQLARLAIRAPFNGVAGIKSINLGDYLKDGADIVGLEDRSRLWADFRLPERFVGAARPGQAVAFSLDALPGRTFEGVVDALDSQLDANGRSLLVRARIDKPAPELKTGMFARSRIVFAVRDQAVVVPEEALVPQGGKQYLYKVVDGPAAPAASTNDNGAPRAPSKVAQRVEATLGARVPGKVEILNGVVAGDLVVTAGHQRLRGESPALRIVELPRAGEAAGARRPPGAASTPAAARVAPPA